MKRKYALHPNDYAIGEMEQFYAEMARRGWKLKRRGAFLSRFDRETPQALRYRVELSSPGLLDEDDALPEEQVALYQDCGWTFVTRFGLVNLFCAPEASDAPEIHTDPRQQARTLRALSRSIWLSWLPALLILAFNLLFAPIASGDPASSAGRLAALMRVSWVRDTAPLLLCAAVLLLFLVQTVYSAARTMALRRRLKRGLPLDHAPRRRRAYRAVQAGLLCAVALFAVLSAAQLLSVRRTDLPQRADGPYLLLRDLGWEGERKPLSYKDKRSSLETSRSLLARTWDVFECVEDGRGGEVSLYQDVYALDSAAQARALAPALLRTAALSGGPEDFRAVAVEGLDAAYQSALEFVAVKDNLVYAITYIGALSDWLDPGEGPADVLTALGNRLGP